MNIIKTSIFRLFLLSIFFLIGARLFYSYLFDNGFGVFNLLIYGTPHDIVSSRPGELLAGDKVFGRFKTIYSNIGIVSIRFTNRNRDSKDVLIFRLKEENEQKWYYEAYYNTDQFQPGKLFPFGFPSIPDSAGKNYIFELESTRGATGSGIYLDSFSPPFVTAAFIDKSSIFKSPSNVISFIFQKIINVIYDKDNLIRALIYFSPFIFFLVFLSTKSYGYQILTLCALMFVLFDIFYLQYYSDILVFSTLILWTLMLLRYKFEARLSAFFALGFLSLTLFLSLSGSSVSAEKSAVWAYLLLCVTAIQQIHEFKYKPKSLISLNHFFKSFPKVKIDETKKSNILAIRTLILFTSLFIVKTLYDTFINIRHSYLLFLDFYQNTSQPPGLIQYCILVGVFVATACLIFYFKRRFLFSNIIYIFIFVLIFQQIMGFTSARLTTFQYSPKIFSITPQTTAEAWVDITVNGKNFQDRPFVGKVFIGEIEQGEYVISWTDEKVVVRTSPVITKSGNICVRTFSKGNSNCLPLEYNFGKENKVK